MHNRLMKSGLQTRPRLFYKLRTCPQKHVRKHDSFSAAFALRSERRLHFQGHCGMVFL
jgi:hypothetical protein